MYRRARRRVKPRARNHPQHVAPPFRNRRRESRVARANGPRMEFVSIKRVAEPIERTRFELD